MTITAPRVVASLVNVPARNYAVTASETASVPAGGVVTCARSPSGAQSSHGVSVERIVTGGSRQSSLVVTDVVTLQNDGDVSLTGDGPPGTSSNNAIITSVQVQPANGSQMPVLSGPASLSTATACSDASTYTTTIAGTGVMLGSNVVFQNSDQPVIVSHIPGQAALDGAISITANFPIGTTWTIYGVDPHNAAISTTYSYP